MRIFIGVLVLLFSVSGAYAAESGSPSKDEIAKELANPNTAFTSLKLQNQFFIFDQDLPRSDDQEMVKLYPQPTN